MPTVRDVVGLIQIVSLALVVCLGIRPAAGQPPDEVFATQVGGEAGLQRLAPGKWGLAGARVSNPTREDIEVEASMFFQDQMNLQFGRRIWVPAGSVRTAWYPLLPPKIVPPRGGFHYSERLHDLSGKPIGDSSDSQPNYKSRRIESDEPMTAMLLDEAVDVGQAENDDDAYEAVLAARVSQRLTRRLAFFSAGALPPVPEGFEAMSHLVIASDKVLYDEGSLQALQIWLRQGGRIWLMLDEVQFETAQRLLGDDLRCQEVDRIALNTLRVVSTERGVVTQKPPLLEFEQPVSLVRVVVSETDVAYEVDGWPAAFWVDVGQGRVLVTTLSARGWMRRRVGDDAQPQRIEDMTDFVARPPLQELAYLLMKTPPPLDQDAVWTDYLDQQIGYRVVPRRTMLWTLGGLVLALCVAGGWLLRTGNVTHIAWIGPLLAVVTAVFVLWMGWSRRAAVPSTLAAGQLVQTSTGSDRILLQGRMRYYTPQLVNQELGSDQAGILFPRGAGQGDTVNRMVRDGLERWRWQNLSFAPGVHQIAFQQTVDSPQRIAATGRFDATGFRGRLMHQQPSELSDAIIHTPSGRSLAIRIAADGSFSATPANVLAPGTFMSASLLNDEQQRRQAVYRRMLQRRPVTSNRPTLFAWSPLMDTGFQLPPHQQQTGAALLEVPLTIERTPADQRLLVPSPFLTYRNVAVGNQAASGLYDYRDRQWIVQRGQVQSHFRFQFPRLLAPLELTRVTIRLAADCPTRRLTIIGYSDEKPVEVAQYNAPARTLEIVIDDPQLLKLDEDVGLVLGFFVDDGGTPNNENRWNFEGLELDAEGVAQQP